MSDKSDRFSPVHTQVDIFQYKMAFFIEERHISEIDAAVKTFKTALVFNFFLFIDHLENFHCCNTRLSKYFNMADNFIKRGEKARDVVYQQIHRACSQSFCRTYTCK